jgi:hypothetical protein
MPRIQGSIAALIGCASVNQQHTHMHPLPTHLHIRRLMHVLLFKLHSEYMETYAKNSTALAVPLTTMWGANTHIRKPLFPPAEFGFSIVPPSYISTHILKSEPKLLHSVEQTLLNHPNIQSCQHWCVFCLCICTIIFLLIWTELCTRAAPYLHWKVLDVLQGEVWVQARSKWWHS